MDACETDWQPMYLKVEVTYSLEGRKIGIVAVHRRSMDFASGSPMGVHQEAS